MRKLLMGNEAIARGALRGGARVVTGYPGTPSTEILETAARLARSGEAPGVYVEWSVNEKAALETAAGAAIAGARALVTMKQVGLNVASDPLMSLNYLGVSGALVIAVADDPGPVSSQTEQDTRRFGLYAKIAVFDPATVEEAYEMAAEAFAFSARYHRPVILRPTTRVCHGYAGVDLDAPPPPPAPPPPAAEAQGFSKDGGRWVIFPRLTYRNHLVIEEQLAEMGREEASPGSGLSAWGPAGKARLGIAAGGVSYAYLMEALGILEEEGPLPAPVKVLKAGRFPLLVPQAEAFLDGLESVLVLEELDPVIEDELTLICGRRGITVETRGKRDGYMPRAGENSVALALDRTRRFLGLEAGADAPGGAVPEPPPPPLPVRPPVLCPGCPHRGSFFAVKEALRKWNQGRPPAARLKAVFSGDIGCYTLGNAPPLDMVDTCLCMGAGVTMAQGLNRAEPGAVNFAFIGDSTFFHTGIPGLINAVYNRANIIVVILDNSSTAMTGGQPHPGTGGNALGEDAPRLSIPAFVEAAGVGELRRANPFDLKEAEEAVTSMLDKTGVRVIIFEGPCAAAKGGAGAGERRPWAVNRGACAGCLACVKRLGCPAISPATGGPGGPGGAGAEAPVAEAPVALIDPALCAGCGLCAQVCPAGAIAVAEGGAL